MNMSTVKCFNSLYFKIAPLWSTVTREPPIYTVTRVLLNMDKTRSSNPGCAQPRARTLRMIYLGVHGPPRRRPARAGTVHDR